MTKIISYMMKEYNREERFRRRKAARTSDDDFILSLYILVKMSCKTRDIGLLLYISANLSYHSASCLSNTFIYTIIYKVKSAKDFAKMQEWRNQISFQVLFEQKYKLWQGGQCHEDLS